MRHDAEASAPILRPRDVADIEDWLRSSHDPVELLGGGTKRGVGAPVDGRPMTLDALAGIVAYEPEELVITVEAGTRLDAVEAVLAEHGQRLAFEPPRFAAGLGFDRDCGATVGGIVAANVAGSRRLSAGAARDHFLGFEAVTGDGVRFKAGGRVVKNVTGYDLPKLLAGSWGTLAVLTRVTLRVVPSAETETTLIVPAATPVAAVDWLTRALATPHDVSSAAFVPDRGAAVRIEGFERSVDARVRRLAEALDAADAERLHDDASRAFWQQTGSAARLADIDCVVRLSVPPSHAGRVVARLEPTDYLLDWGGGLIWAGFDAVDVDDIRTRLEEGHATLWKAPDAARRHTAVFPPVPPGAAAATARVRAAFDPHGRLNPGRLGARAAHAATADPR